MDTSSGRLSSEIPLTPDLEVDTKSVSCPNCGASLSYKPGTTSQICEYCESSFEIKIDNARTADAQKEVDLSTALPSDWKPGWRPAQAQIQTFVVKCPACGAQTALEKKMFSTECAFCGSLLTIQPKEGTVAKPQAVLPFKLDKDTATAKFTKWLSKLWFAPNSLKNSASTDRFNGVYLPLWTFDADSETTYLGERGHHYTETHRNSKGETETVTETRWVQVSGQVNQAFNDILVTGSRILPEKYLKNLEPWDLANLVPYDNRFLSGIMAAVSEVDISVGFDEADRVMASAIKCDVLEDIGGDEQRITHMHTLYHRATYKYILLPVWLSVFRYGNKIYRCVVNARTGEVHGERPYSAIKIALAVMAALIIICLVIYFTR